MTKIPTNTFCTECGKVRCICNQVGDNPKKAFSCSICRSEEVVTSLKEGGRYTYFCLTHYDERRPKNFIDHMREQHVKKYVKQQEVTSE